METKKLICPNSGIRRDSLADRATLTRSRAGVCSLGLRAPGRRISFFAYAQKTKPFTGPLQNGSVHLGDGNISYVSMNHFEVATATQQQKGMTQKRNPPAHPKGDRNTPHLRWGMGGGGAILKQATVVRRTGQERNPAEYPGIWVICIVWRKGFWAGVRGQGIAVLSAESRVITENHPSHFDRSAGWYH